MTEEYGENWKKIWDKKWKDDVKRRKKEHDKRINELEAKINKEK